MTWRNIGFSGGGGTENPAISLTIRPDNPDHLYMTLNYNEGKTPPLWFSTENGSTWTPFEDYPFCSAHRVAFDPKCPEEIIVTTYGASALRGPAYPAKPAEL